MVQEMAALGAAWAIAFGQAQNSRSLPDDPPPRIVTVVETDAENDAVVYRDYFFTPPDFKSGRPKPNELIPADGPGRPLAAFSVRFPLKQGTVLNVDGKRVPPGKVIEQLETGDSVVVSRTANIDTAYLRILRAETLILIHPAPPPGPPVPDIE